MRRVDDGVRALEGLEFSGVVRVAASNSMALARVLPAATRVAISHPKIVPMIVDVNAKCSELLRTGGIDIAMIEGDALDQDDIAIAHAGDLSYGIYCGASHVLSSGPCGSLEDVARHPFVAPHASLTSDGWPVEVQRRIGITVNALNLALAACHSGHYLASLPDEVGALQSGLVHLPIDLPRKQVLFLATRRPLSTCADRTRVFARELMPPGNSSDSLCQK